MSNTVTIVVSRDQPATAVRLRGPQNFRFVRSDDVRVELVGESEAACNRLRVQIRNGELTADPVIDPSDPGGGRFGSTTEIRVGSVTITGRSMTVGGTPVAGTITRKGIRMFDATEGPHEIVLYQPSCPSIHLAGAGDAILEDVAQPTLSIDLKGAGSLTGSGRLSELSLTMSGAGDADLSLLRAHRVHVVASGAGNVTVAAWDTVTGRLSGVGDLRVFGDPYVREVRHTGIGNVLFVQCPAHFNEDHAALTDGAAPLPNTAKERASTESPSEVAARLVRELEDGTADVDLRAWAREAAPILAVAGRALPLLAQIVETLDLGAKIKPESEVHDQLKGIVQGG